MQCKNAWNCTSTLPYTLMAWCLKNRETYLLYEFFWYN
jgi:hypothetical protein